MERIIFFFLFICLFQGCDKDPISGLERGWVWDAIGLENKNDDSPGELRIEMKDWGTNSIFIFKGATTGGDPLISITLNEGDIRTIELERGEYTINSDACNCSEVFELKSCKEIKVWNYTISIYDC